MVVECLESVWRFNLFYNIFFYFERKVIKFTFMPKKYLGRTKFNATLYGWFGKSPILYTTKSNAIQLCFGINLK